VTPGWFPIASGGLGALDHATSGKPAVRLEFPAF
jgi:hypothetical protein